MAIALLTDFGEADYFAGSVKGAVLSIDPEASLIDITHSIPRHDIQSAAFCLSACYRDFPAGTVFLCVVDPGVGSSRRGLAVSADGRFFVAPDNGLLTFVMEADPLAIAVELENQEYFAPMIGATFHGRDIFAPAAAHISKGVEISAFGGRAGNVVLLQIDKVFRVSGEKLRGSIIHIDGFGNLVTNIPATEADRILFIEIAGRKIDRHALYYEEASPEELFFIAGSAGYIEVCIFGGSAAGQLHSLVADPLEAHLKTGV